MSTIYVTRPGNNPNKSAGTPNCFLTPPPSSLYRKKGYQNPYYDITDKVGARFVVLLTTDIRKIKDIIYLSTDWSYSEDRDYEKERQKNPLEFTYQSVHYVLKSIDNVEHNGIVIPMGTFCEVQVRTLLQHAHSELTHDSIYKSNRPAPPDIYRTAAKSMALIETTDEFFEQVTIDVNEFTKKERQIISILDNLYRERFPDIEPLKCKSSFLIIESFLDKVSDNFEHELRTFFDKNDFLLERISEKNYLHLYKQSVILLLFFMFKKYKS